MSHRPRPTLLLRTAPRSSNRRRHASRTAIGALYPSSSIGAFKAPPSSCELALGRIFVPLCILLLAVPLLSGCLGFQRAEVPDAYLDDGWKVTDSGGGKRWLGIVAEWAHLTYEVNPSQTGVFDDGPYAAALQVFTVDTPGRMDREEVSSKLDEQIRENAEAQRLTIDQGSKRTGERTLDSGVRTIFFTYEARIQAGSPLFDSGMDARIIGEVWYHEPSGNTVVVVGLAQTQGGGATGRYFDDRSNWEVMVGDPDGSVEGVGHDAGMIYHIRMVRQ